MKRHLYERKRYIVFEVISEKKIRRKELLKEIWDSVYSLYGDKGASESKIKLLEFDNGTGRGILRCAHKKVEEIRAVLACISSVDEAKVGIRVIRTSGTIKAARGDAKTKKKRNKRKSRTLSG